MRSSRSCNKREGLRSIRAVLLAVGTLAIAGEAHAQETNENMRRTADAHVIRVWAYEGFSKQLLRWEAAYRSKHPEIQFKNELHGAASIMAGLYNGVADIALMGREIWPVDTMAYQWVYQERPFGVMVATAGLNGPGQAFTPVVIVNAGNPLKSISLSQLDAVYGSEHRAAPENIRRWGELGLRGTWASQPIHAYGFGAEDALGVFFRHDVLLSDFKPNPESHLFSDRDGNPVPAATRIIQAIAADPYAIGYTSLPQSTSVKILPIVKDSPIEAAEEKLLSHQYPLTRSISLYFHRESDKPVEPKLDGFIHFLLSAEAQNMIRSDEGLLPLSAEILQKQIQKLDSPMPKGAKGEEKE